MTKTLHISYKQNELPLLERERELGELLHKNRSDTYKYCMNRTYLELMTKSENGEHINVCWHY